MNTTKYFDITIIAMKNNYSNTKVKL